MIERRNFVSKMQIVSILTIVIGMFFFITKVDAEEIAFIVEPIYTDTQISSEKDFYYIKTEPKKEQTIETKISNISKTETITIMIEPTNLISQNNGEMGYRPINKKKDLDETLVNPMSSILTVEKNKIKLAPGESTVSKTLITPPGKNFEGVIAGGLLFTQISEDQSSVKATYSYGIGVLLSETTDNYTDSTSLNLLEAKASVNNNKKVILAKLQNPEPKIMDQLKITAEIKEKSSNKSLKKKVVTDYQMAPNSNFDLLFDWGHKKIKSGQYVMVVDGETPYKTWHLTKDFTITDAQAKKINDSSPYKLVTPQWVKITAIVITILTLLISTVILIRRNRRSKQWKIYKIEKKQNKKKKRKRS
ncbi:MAG: WxL protein host-binding domain-containing protein [Vagococcus salmoninarum]|uniref:DUF3324 domain-containing protein n=1 Tax=Vagococcus salmoninarum TaxID=2739 RepID=UPI003F9AEFD3